MNTDVKLNVLTILKVFFSLIIIQFIIMFFVILLLNNNNIYNTDFKNNWNNLYISWNSNEIIKLVQKHNITNSKVKECRIEWFYTENNLLYFCKDLRIFQFPNTKLKTEDFITNFNIKFMIQLMVLVFWSSFIFTLFSLIFNNSYFLSFHNIKSYNRDDKQRELDDLYSDLKEDIEKSIAISKERLLFFSAKAYQLLVNEKQLYKEYYYWKLRKIAMIAKSNGMDEEYSFLKRAIIKIEKNHSYFISKIQWNIHYFIFRYLCFSPYQYLNILWYLLFSWLLWLFTYTFYIWNIDLDNEYIKYIDFLSIKDNIYIEAYVILVSIFMVLLLIKNMYITMWLKSIYKIK